MKTLLGFLLAMVLMAPAVVRGADSTLSGSVFVVVGMGAGIKLPLAKVYLLTNADIEKMQTAAGKMDEKIFSDARELIAQIQASPAEDSRERRSQLDRVAREVDSLRLAAWTTPPKEMEPTTLTDIDGKFLVPVGEDIAAVMIHADRQVPFVGIERLRWVLSVASLKLDGSTNMFSNHNVVGSENRKGQLIEPIPKTTVGNGE